MWARLDQPLGRDWILTVGQVTAVVIGRLVTWEIAPMTDQTKLNWPCSSSQGW